MTQPLLKSVFNLFWIEKLKKKKKKEKNGKLYSAFDFGTTVGFET